ncbi:helix-turn-helix domain-containing protein [Candidatus Roizmanbacteria bacterium]|nr:helix-turn-helix domain-containing protein [Candidatus Roizmanbacteria bacterium]
MKINTSKNVFDYIENHKQIKPGELAKHLGISRVTIHKQIKKLLLKGKIEKIGITPHVQYRPHHLWDYDYDELKKTEQGRIKILERMINYGPGERKKIPLDQVKKYWDKLELNYLARRLLELLIWGKYQSSPKNKKFSWI